MRRPARLARITAVAAWRGLLGFYRDDDLTFAASVAYYALLSLFPFLLLALSILGATTVDDGDRRAVLEFVLRYFPAQFDFVTEQLDAFREKRLQLGVFSAIALAWAARGVFGAISTGVNHAWGVERQRSYLGHQLFTFLMLSAAGALVLVALMLVSAREIVEASWFSGVLARFPALRVLEAFTVRQVPTVLLIMVTALIYYFVPNTRVRFSDVWVGAIITALLLRWSTTAFSWSMRDLTSFAMIHGSITATVIFLIWVHLLACILLYGAEFTVAFAALRREGEVGRP